MSSAKHKVPNLSFMIILIILTDKNQGFFVELQSLLFAMVSMYDETVNVPTLLRQSESLSQTHPTV